MTQSHPHPEQLHEGVSVRPRQIVIAVIGLVALILASLLLVSGLNSFLAREENARVVPDADPDTPMRGTPLEPDQRDRKREYLAEQQELLNSSDWLDREQGIARIPIEDAMRLYVERQEGAE